MTQCHTVHHKSQVECLGPNTCRRNGWLAPNRLSVRVCVCVCVCVHLFILLSFILQNVYFCLSSFIPLEIKFCRHQHSGKVCNIIILFCVLTDKSAGYSPGHTWMCRVQSWAYMDVQGTVMGIYECAGYSSGHTWMCRVVMGIYECAGYSSGHTWMCRVQYGHIWMCRYSPGHTWMCRVQLWAYMNVQGTVLDVHECAGYSPGHTWMCRVGY